MKKRKTFTKHLVVCAVFLEFQYLVDDLFDFLELPKFINVFYLDISFNEVDRAFGHETKDFVRCHIYRLFFKNLLRMT